MVSRIGAVYAQIVDITWWKVTPGAVSGKASAVLRRRYPVLKRSSIHFIARSLIADYGITSFSSGIRMISVDDPFGSREDGSSIAGVALSNSYLESLYDSTAGIYPDT
jgi:hypothetical protein